MHELALTFDQVVAIGRAIYGKVWIEPMANDLGYDNSTVYRWSAGKMKNPTVSRKASREIRRLARRKNIALPIK